MRPASIAIYLGFLAILLIVAIAGGRIQDESQRQLLDVWALACVLAAVLLVGWFGFFRSTGKKREQIARIDSSSNGRKSTYGSSHAPRVGLILAMTVAGLCITWTSLIYLGSMWMDAESTALVNIQLMTSMITAGAALFLSRSAAIIEASKIWLLRLVAVLMLLFEALGLIVLPLVAMRVWTGYIDFPAYSHALNLNWFFLTLAAVAFCLFRSRRQTGKTDS